jgi:hypothetical protein
MTQDLTTIETEEDGAPVDPDFSIIAAYLAGALTVEQMAIVDARLETDSMFRTKVQPVISVWYSATDYDDGSVAALVKPKAPEQYVSREDLDAGWKRFRAERHMKFTHKLRRLIVRRTFIIGAVAAFFWVLLLLVTGTFTSLIVDFDGAPSETFTQHIRGAFNRSVTKPSGPFTRRIDIGGGSYVVLSPMSGMSVRPVYRSLGALALNLEGDATIHVSRNTRTIWLATPAARASLLGPGVYVVHAPDADSVMTLRTDSGVAKVTPRGWDLDYKVSEGRIARVRKGQMPVVDSVGTVPK